MRELMAQLMGNDPEQYPHGRMTYDLRRLRLHALIQRIPHSHRYQVTDVGMRVAMFFSRTYVRLLCPGLSDIMPQASPSGSKLRKAFDHLLQQIDSQCQALKMAA